MRGAPHLYRRVDLPSVAAAVEPISDADAGKRIYDADTLVAERVRTTRLLGPFDLFLQAKDRSLLLDDPARAKALWPVLGRPGAVLLNGEIAGLWRPRKAGHNLRVHIELWAKASTSVRKAVTEQAERLAAYRQVTLSGLDTDG